MKLASKETLISAYAALATIAIGLIGYDSIVRHLAPGPFAPDFKIPAVASPAMKDSALTADTSDAPADRTPL